MTICYFGFYNPKYDRNKILIRGLKENGIAVIECQSSVRGIGKYVDVVKKHWSLRKKYDVMIVGFPGYQAMMVAKLLCKTPIVFDAFSSLYDSMVFDREMVRRKSIRGFYYWILDWLSCVLADKILLDTNEHIRYFVKTFCVPIEKFERVFVGADDLIYYPKTKSLNRPKDFTVHFHGSFIPLQGIEYIIQAAKMVMGCHVSCNIVGYGQTLPAMKKLASDIGATNIHFIEIMNQEDFLNVSMNEADLCLGIFGNTAKAQRVIPNKIYQAFAAGCPVLTAESSAEKEALTDRQNVLFCRGADAASLAEKILLLKNNDALRDHIAQGGYKLFKDNFTPLILGKQMVGIIKGLV